MGFLGQSQEVPCEGSSWILEYLEFLGQSWEIPCEGSLWILEYQNTTYRLGTCPVYLGMPKDVTVYGSTGHPLEY